MREPKICKRERMILAGLSYYGDPFAASGDWTEENEIGRLWNRFGAYLAHHRDRILDAVDLCVCYEVHIMHGDTQAKGHYEVFVGTEVSDVKSVPVELLVKVLPPSDYATLTLEGKEITSDWGMWLYREWMPAAGYEEAFPYMFQAYDGAFKGLDNLDESTIEAFAPIKPLLPHDTPQKRSS